MTDAADAWHSTMIRAGERALELRDAGHTWGAIADALRIGDAGTARRAAALFLAADYIARRTAGEPPGDARPASVADAPPPAKRRTWAFR